MAVERVSSSFYTLRLLIIDGDTKTAITDVLFTIVQNTPRKYCVFLNAQTLFTRWQPLPKFRNVDPVLRPLTFDLSTTKWGHSRVARVMGFLPANYQLAPFHSRFGVRHGTVRRTDRRRPS